MRQTNLPYPYPVITLRLTACKGCTFRLFTLTGIASFYADLAGMALTFVIIHAVHSFTVDLACWGSLARRIAVGITLPLHKAVTAGLNCALCLVSSDLDLIQVTIKLLVMGTGLYRTS